MPPAPQLPPGPARDVNPCESDTHPQCDPAFNDTFFFTDIVEQITPYTIGALVWDQAERDVKCPTSLASYACMEQRLVTSWRAAFGSPHAPFVAVQLPGYTGAYPTSLPDGGCSKVGCSKDPTHCCYCAEQPAPGGCLDAGSATCCNSYINAEMVYAMRLQQDAGVRNVSAATVVPTYDLSVPTSPYGSVHNTWKNPIGARIATQLRQAFGGSPVLEGPRATSATARVVAHDQGGQLWEVTVEFEGGSAPFVLAPTKNCTTCCDGGDQSQTLDFSLAQKGRLRGTNVTDVKMMDAHNGRVSFKTKGPFCGGAVDCVVLYTAASIFPQCAIKNAEGLPLLPFEMEVDVVPGIPLEESQPQTQKRAAASSRGEVGSCSTTGPGALQQRTARTSGGTLLATATVAEPPACAAHCCETALCRSWTHVAGSCEMRSGYSAATPNATATSGVVYRTDALVTDPPQAFFAGLRGFNYVPPQAVNDIDQVTDHDRFACRSAFSHRRRCMAVDQVRPRHDRARHGDCLGSRLQLLQSVPELSRVGGGAGGFPGQAEAFCRDGARAWRLGHADTLRSLLVRLPQ